METINKKTWIGTKEQYLTTFPNGTDRPTYIVDLPTVEISNADMALALTTQAKFYKEGQILICSDDGTYTKGHLYQYSTSGWTDITASGGSSGGTDFESSEVVDISDLSDPIYIATNGTSSHASTDCALRIADVINKGKNPILKREPYIGIARPSGGYEQGYTYLPFTVIYHNITNGTVLRAYITLSSDTGEMYTVFMLIPPDASLTQIMVLPVSSSGSSNSQYTIEYDANGLTLDELTSGSHQIPLYQSDVYNGLTNNPLLVLKNVNMYVISSSYLSPIALTFKADNVVTVPNAAGEGVGVKIANFSSYMGTLTQKPGYHISAMFQLVQNASSSYIDMQVSKVDDVTQSELDAALGDIQTLLDNLNTGTGV